MQSRKHMTAALSSAVTKARLATNTRYRAVKEQKEPSRANLEDSKRAIAALKQMRLQRFK